MTYVQVHSQWEKSNVVLYVDKDIGEKSKELGFNLLKTFDNHLKHLIKQFLADKTLPLQFNN